jgi:hypothetical protein
MTEYPVTLIFPPEVRYRLVTVRGQTQVLEDGSIKAVFNDPDELFVCLEASKVCMENFVRQQSGEKPELADAPIAEAEDDGIYW